MIKMKGDSMLARFLALFGLFFLPTSALHAAEMLAADRFEQLKALEGDWSGQSDSGRAWRLSYKPIANGTVLVERWTSTSGKETMTVFHMDGARLLATHYCGQGNQPRLALVSPPSEARMAFRFVDATNLPDPEASHQHAMTVEAEGPDRLVRTETYRARGHEETDRIVFTRLASR